MQAINLEAGAFRWSVLPTWLRGEPCGGAARLFDAGGPPLDEWVAAGRAHVVKHGPHRTVYHLVLPGLDCYLKQYRPADPRARLRELVRPSKARVEWERTLIVAGRGVPTVEPLAVGESSAGDASSFLLTRTLPDAVPLNTFLEKTLATLPPPRRTRLRQRVAVALGECLARMHDAGVTQHDLHPGNLLLRLADDVPALYLVDLHTVRIGGPLAWGASRANLAVLNRWFVLRAERSDRLRFWRAYCGSRRHIGGVAHWLAARRDPVRSSDTTSPPHHLAQECSRLERQTLGSNLRLWRSLDRRCLETNRSFRVVRADGVAGHVVAELSCEVVAELLRDPDAPSRRPGVKVLKHSPSVTVIELELPCADGPRRVIYKRFAVTRWSDPLVALVRRTPALRSYVMGHALLNRLLPTPRPLAVWHRYRYGLPHEGYLLTEKMPDAPELRDYVTCLQATSAAGRSALRRLIEQAARLIAALHQRHLSHRDLKATNLLVREGQIAFIDLVGVRRHRKLSRARRVQNLARLNTSFLARPELTRTDRLRFLRVYLRWGLRGKEGWKRWWRQIEQATCAKIERNRRSGRPLA